MAHARYELSVLAPFRLNLVVNALRRLSSNVVDTLSADGSYVRALSGVDSPVFVNVAQNGPEQLSVSLDGDTHDHPQALASLRRTFGVDRDLAPFNHAAAQIAWLAPLARRMLGVKPPRYPTLWEACVNAVVFQQVSLIAANAIMRRMVFALVPPLDYHGSILYEFPREECVLAADDALLRGAGLSANKLATLRRVAEALACGTLDEAMLEQRSSADASTLLQGIKGIGPWTATVILLRGLGRLDVFPMNDTSVARNLALIVGNTAFDVPGTLQKLGEQRGMLYYHLLLARLEARGALGPATVTN